jgi:hypothetical protein
MLALRTPDMTGLLKPVFLYEEFVTLMVGVPG